MIEAAWEFVGYNKMQINGELEVVVEDQEFPDVVITPRNPSMDDLNGSSDSSESSKDEPRQDMLWEHREEALLLAWRAELFDLSKKHGAEGLVCQRMYTLIGLPASILPLVTTLFEDNKPVLTALLVLTGVVVGGTTFLNFGKLCAEHLEYESRYETLARNIDRCMAIPKKHRISAGVFIERTLNKYNALNKQSPSLMIFGKKSIPSSLMAD
jgi:hypothetical protein